MQEEKKVGKDAFKDTHLALKDKLFSISYSKTSKLITALYMVTEIMDKNEPIRQKLRSAGADLLSDTLQQQYISRTNLLMDINKKITEIMSFMDIASTIGMISEMNNRIIKNEFALLKKSLNLEENSVWLEEFLADGSTKGHETLSDRNPVRIGVQKSSNLLKVLENMKSKPESVSVSDRKKVTEKQSENKKDSYDKIKLERRYDIMQVIRNTTGGATISDIRSKGHGTLKGTGEKTLQRELVSMVADGVLYKTGEKRWSKYFLK